MRFVYPGYKFLNRNRENNKHALKALSMLKIFIFILNNALKTYYLIIKYTCATIFVC